VSAVLPIRRDVSLADRYELEEGSMLLTGIQAMTRLVFDQMRADRQTGLRIRALVSGYPGSPLGGFDAELGRQRKLREELGVVHNPGLNEDLAATSVWGSQIAPTLPGATVDGVLGVWYGKAPGVDRSGDAFRHGSFAGAHPNGGLLAFCGDDPACKSSTVPSASESILAALRMPVLAPGSPQEVLDLGRHAIALSRASGMWAALKIATNVADAASRVVLDPRRVSPLPVVVEDNGRPYVHVPNGSVGPPHVFEMERTLTGPRHALALEYARVNGLNRVTVEAPEATLGLVASGSTYTDLREALGTLGLDDEALADLGIRILKLGMIWPLEPSIIRSFASGLNEIIVIEEKDPFVETLVRDVLYAEPERPRVLGKRDENGAELVPRTGQLDPDQIARAVGARVLRRGSVASVEARLNTLAQTALVPGLPGPVRLPFFCSGCPHNTSTDAPDGALVGAGIGCHSMVVLSPAGKGELTGVVQMGAEGAQWIGQAPFVEADHIFQNLGDGTFHHSGSLAVRAAVASGVNMTYKLLYNRAIAMTGGQAIAGEMSVPAITQLLQAEGVTRIIVTTDEPNKYRGVELAAIAEVRDRSDVIGAQRELQAVQGVSFLIHDQECAAEKRRARKRGKLVEPKQHAFINRRVCEGCGDCGRKSHCLSVQPIDTEFGSKTTIDQASCNKDYSCLKGDCPSFLIVEPGERAKAAFPTPPSDLPLPEGATEHEEVTLRLIGIGGTGVVTVAQVLGMAAVLDGKHTTGLSQTGLAQKGGPVISDVRFVRDESQANRAVTGGVDAYIGFDLLGAANPTNLQTASSDRTVAAISTSEVPTGSMIGDPEARFVDISEAIEHIERRTRADRNVYVDADHLTTALFGSHALSNTLLLGVAWQQGLIPLSLDAIHEAFRLNGASVETNLAAFDWGRAAVAAPDAVARVTTPRRPDPVKPGRRARSIIGRVGAAPGSELERLVTIRVPELIAYQGPAYAARYAEVIAAVRHADAQAGGDGSAANAVARNLYALMAYKDEYEVARLHLDPGERARLTEEFGPDAKIKFLLQPPFMRALGMNRKIALGEWFDPMFRLLKGSRRLRGTALDPFGRAEVRRVERALPGEYRDLIDRVLPYLASDYAEAVELLKAPAVIRGYENVKLGNVAVFRERVQAQLEALGAAKTTAVFSTHPDELPAH
jgi:indolepyruvate ferredoxin oxidoreductase